MDLENFLSHILNLAGTYTSQTAILVFLICFISEGFGLTIPYLLETTWLISGYQLARGGATINYLFLLVFMAQAGRLTGSLLFFYLSRFSAGPLIRLTKLLKLRPVVTRSSEMFRKVNLLSPFSVAIGRLLGLRIPVTIILGAKRKLKILALGIFFSSLAFDGTYIALGSIVGTAVVNPPYVFVCFAAGLLLMYGIAFLFRRSGQLILDRFGGRMAVTTENAITGSWIETGLNHPNQNNEATGGPATPKSTDQTKR
ncbi:MAG: hypothetical protein N3E40_02290 [Dehalococcoidia bacterium]|nr:hypothetical protein [Dehalococcoidia bacterium]